jgi:enoyl-CoA hydratase
VAADAACILRARSNTEIELWIDATSCCAPALGLPTLFSAGSRAGPLTSLSGEQNVENQSAPFAGEGGINGRRMVDAPLSPDTKVTIERRKQIVLIGINRPQMLNKIDPDTFYGLATAYYDFDNDPTLRAAVLFGHGENFCRGNDVEAFSALAKTGKAFKLNESQIDPLGRAKPLSKPLVAVVHGDTWNMGHELHLFADVRVASNDVRYRQTENAYGRVPGVAPVRLVREAGWANAMRYLLTGDPWDAQTAYRMGIVQEVAPNKDAALKIGIDLANGIAACGPLGVKATLKVAHIAINDSADAAAFAQLEAEYLALFNSQDSIEGRKAEAENRTPIFQGR